MTIYWLDPHARSLFRLPSASVIVGPCGWRMHPLSGSFCSAPRSWPLYSIGGTVEERLLLIRMVQLGWITAVPVVRSAAELLRGKGRRMSAAALQRELPARGRGALPCGAVA